MRVKIGDDWFDATPSQPIMIELTEQDKRNIINISDLDVRTTEEKLEWMEWPTI